MVGKWRQGVVGVAVLLWLVSSVPLGAAEFDHAKLGRIRPAMQKFVDKGDISGAVTVVGSRQGIAHIEAVGLANIGQGLAMSADAVFLIASMTKPITALAIMMLADEGKLDVNDPVEKHLPEFRGQMLQEKADKDGVVLKKPSRPITIRDLLTHTSGLPGFPEGMSNLYEKRTYTLGEATAAMSQRPLMFEPGSKWSYCNSGIDALGRIVEVSSGKSFEGFVKERIFDPLAMKDTAFYPSKEQLGRVATMYGKKGKKLIEATGTLIGSPVNAKHPIPAGGLFSTGKDLAQFYQAMLHGGTVSMVKVREVNGKKETVLYQTKLLSPKAHKEMTSLQTGDIKGGFTPGSGFGYGWAFVKEPQGVTSMLSPGSYGHGGAFGTQGWLDPKQDLFVILLIQRVGLPNADASELRRELQALAVEAIKK